MKYIKIRSRKGKFNLCDLSEISISTNICIIEDNKTINEINIETEYDETDNNDPDDVLQLLEEWDKRMLVSTSRQKAKTMMKYIEENLDALYEGTLLKEKEDLEKKKEKIMERYNVVINSLKLMGEE